MRKGCISDWRVNDTRPKNVLRCSAVRKKSTCERNSIKPTCARHHQHTKSLLWYNRIGTFCKDPSCPLRRDISDREGPLNLLLIETIGIFSVWALLFWQPRTHKPKAVMRVMNKNTQSSGFSFGHFEKKPKNSCIWKMTHSEVPRKEVWWSGQYNDFTGPIFDWFLSEVEDTY